MYFWRKGFFLTRALVITLTANIWFPTSNIKPNSTLAGKQYFAKRTFSYWFHYLVPAILQGLTHIFKFLLLHLYYKGKKKTQRLKNSLKNAKLKKPSLYIWIVIKGRTKKIVSTKSNYSWPKWFWRNNFAFKFVIDVSYLVNGVSMIDLADIEEPLPSNFEMFNLVSFNYLYNVYRLKISKFIELTQ